MSTQTSIFIGEKYNYQPFPIIAVPDLEVIRIGDHTEINFGEAADALDLAAAAIQISREVSRTDHVGSAHIAAVLTHALNGYGTATQSTQDAEDDGGPSVLLDVADSDGPNGSRSFVITVREV